MPKGIAILIRNEKATPRIADTGSRFFHFELEWRCLLACISVIHGRILVIFSILRILLVVFISLILQIFSQCHCEKYYSSSLVGSGNFYNFVAAS